MLHVAVTPASAIVASSDRDATSLVGTSKTVSILTMLSRAILGIADFLDSYFISLCCSCKTHMAGQTNLYSQLLISAIWIVDINYSNCWYQQFELEISTIIIADITNSKWIIDISNWNCWYQQFKLLISLINSN